MVQCVTSHLDACSRRVEDSWKGRSPAWPRNIFYDESLGFRSICIITGVVVYLKI